MKKGQYYLSLLCAILVFTACSSDDGNPSIEPDPVDPSAPCAIAPSAVVFKELQAKAYENMIQRKTIYDPLYGINFTSKMGVNFVIFPGGLGSEEEENVMNGEVEVEFLELFDRASMVLADKPMMGKNEAGVFGPVATFGHFYVNVTQDGKDLTPVFLNLHVPPVVGGVLEPDLVLWEAFYNDQMKLDWGKFIMEPTEISTGVQLNDYGEDYEYIIAFMDFGWLAINRVDEMLGTRSPIKVNVPECYNNENSAVYVAVRGESRMLGALDVFDTETNSFTEEFGWGQEGTGVSIIMLSEREGSFVYAIKDVGSNRNVTIAAGDFKKATETELLTAVRAIR